MESLISIIDGFTASEKEQLASLLGYGKESSEESDSIAIIGMACRFPRTASTPQKYWDMLVNGLSGISEVPSDRWSNPAYYDTNKEKPAKIVSRWGGFLDDVKSFDPRFFGISPMEAAYVDPQQRLMLETAWEALENSGYTQERIHGSNTGVFAGVSTVEYQWPLFQDLDKVNAYAASGFSHAIMANRISYCLNLKGPSMALDSACSSSLVTPHLACQSLRNRECDLAIAGGVNVIVTPHLTLSMSKFDMLSVDGLCKTFDHGANGFVRGEGAGVVVLKRLKDAERDGDPILAVIRGSAVNQDGKTSGLSAPNGPAQREVIAEALSVSGVDHRSISYIETHGTGTSLGDPIEVESLNSVYGVDNPNKIYLGAVKTNIGHLENGAGIASLIKAVLCLTNRQIPRNLNFEKANPHIDFEETPFVLPLETTDWNPKGKRRAGISSFGFGGTNCHMIVEEYAKPANERTGRMAAPDRFFMPLSAKTKSSLKKSALEFADFLGGLDDPETLAEIFQKLRTKRSHFNHRIAVTGVSKGELIDKLRAFARGHAEDILPYADVSKLSGRVAFVFPGQGSQWFGMGQQLYRHEVAFRDEIDLLSQGIEKWGGFDLKSVLFEKVGELRLNNEVNIIQPALFAIQVALAKVMESWKIRPHVTIGHSMGEVAAAYVAGILNADDACRIICLRSRIASKSLSGKGSMALVDQSATLTQDAIQQSRFRVEIAADNGMESCIISGEDTQVDGFLSTLDADKLFFRKVKVDYASHCHVIDEVKDELIAALKGIQPGAGQTKFWSTVKGRLLTGTEADHNYWYENLRNPVRLWEVVRKVAAEEEVDTFIEVSPHAILVKSLKSSFEKSAIAAEINGVLTRNQDEVRAMEDCRAFLYTRLEPFHYPAEAITNRVTLPNYCFDRQEYWIAHQWLNGESQQLRKADRIEILEIPEPQSDRIYGSVKVSVEQYPYLKDHTLNDSCILPAAFFVDMVASFSRKRFGTGTLEIRDLTLERPTVVTEEIELVIVADVFPQELKLKIYRKGESEQVASCEVFYLPDSVVSKVPKKSSTKNQALASRDLYENLSQKGLHYGPSFRLLSELELVDGEIRAKASLDHGLSAYEGVIAPALLDAALQTTLARLFATSGDSRIHLPLSFGRIRIWGDIRQDIVVTAASNSPDSSAMKVYSLDIRGADNDGGMEISDFLIAEPGELMESKGVKDMAFYPVWMRMAATALPAPRKKRLMLVGDRLASSEMSPLLAAKSELVRGLDFDSLNGSFEWEECDRIVVFFPKARSGTYSDLHRHSLFLLRLLQNIASMVTPPQLVLCTQLAHRIDDVDRCENFQLAPLWNMLRVARRENEALESLAIDYDEASIHEAALEVLTFDPEAVEVGFRRRIRYVPELTHRAVHAAPQDLVPVIKGQGTYLITGGTGSLGLLVARWLIEKGARSLALVSRSKPNEDVAREIRGFEANGCRILTLQADISRLSDVQSLLTQLPEDAPLLGIIHLAGVLRDAALINQSPSSFEEALLPKCLGALHLYDCTRDRPLDFTLYFSSATAILGTQGQINYAAANGFLDAFAAYQTAQGKRAISINWGAWDETGLADRLSIAKKETLRSQGVGFIPPRQGLLGISLALASEHHQLVFMNMNWRNYGRAVSHASIPKMLRPRIPAFAEASNPESRPIENLDEKLGAAPREDLAAIVREHVRAIVAGVLKIVDPTTIDESAGFSELGMDSLMTIQLRIRLERSSSLRVPIAKVFSNPSVAALSHWIFETFYSQTNQENSDADELSGLDAFDSADSAVDFILSNFNEVEAALETR